MRTLVLSTVALGALTTAALADPATPPAATTGPSALTDEQMDRVTAGQAVLLGGRPPGEVDTPGASASVNLLAQHGGEPAEFRGEPGETGRRVITSGAPGSIRPGEPSPNI